MPTAFTGLRGVRLLGDRSSAQMLRYRIDRSALLPMRYGHWRIGATQPSQRV